MQNNTDLMDLVAGYREYAAADELTAETDAPAATPAAISAFFASHTIRQAAAGAAVGSGSAVSWRWAC